MLHAIEDPDNDNVDVVVQLSDGERRTITFFTVGNIASLMRRHAETGECLSGRYFWSVDMVIVDTLTIERIREVIEEMVANGEYDTAFGSG